MHGLLLHFELMQPRLKTVTGMLYDEQTQEFAP